VSTNRGRDGGVLIVGGGVIGVCTAYRLAKRGIPVTLVEREREICPLWASSFGNAGMVVPSDGLPIPGPGVIRSSAGWLTDPLSPLYVKPRPDPAMARWLWRFRSACTEESVQRAIPALLALARESAARFDELAAAGLRFTYERRGWLQLYSTPEGMAGGSADAKTLARYGVRAEVLDARAACEHVPGIASGVAGGVLYPDDAHLTPDEFVRAVAAAAQDKGARLLTGVEVLDADERDGRVVSVTTTRGTFAPERLVLAAGVWSTALAAKLGLRLPVVPGKGYAVTIERPVDYPELPTYLSEQHVCVTPMGDRLRFAGTMEFAGLDFAVDRRRVKSIRRAAQSYLGALASPAAMQRAEIWRGLRPMTPDSLPVIGRSPRHANLVIATGNCMLGMTQGPGTGELAAQLVAGEEPSIDLAPFALERFAPRRSRPRLSDLRRTVRPPLA